MGKVICGIYQIYNTVNGKRYIGLSRDVSSRFSQHKRCLNGGRHSNSHLQTAWNMYGEDAFEFSVIEETSLAELQDREIYWIKYYDSFKNGYNRSGGGDGTSNVIFDEERSRAISERLKGVPRFDLRGGNAPMARKVVCLNTQEVFDCIKHAAEKYDINYTGIVSTLKNGGTVGKDALVFCYYEEYILMDSQDISDRIATSIEKRKRSSPLKPIVCLNTGELFRQAKDATDAYGLSTISNLHKCCKHVQHSCGVDAQGHPLYWLYLDEYLSMSDSEISDFILDKQQFVQKKSKVVCTTTGELFETKAAAAKRYNINHAHFNESINRNGKYELNRNNEHLIFVAA